MKDMFILSNNPLLVKAGEENPMPVLPVAGDGLGAVYSAALELTQSGYKLVSAPLPPNLPLMRAPYRSLLLKKTIRQYDAEGIMALEKAREKIAAIGSVSYTEEQAMDAAFIDQEILKRALRECGAATAAA